MPSRQHSSHLPVVCRVLPVTARCAPAGARGASSSPAPRAAAAGHAADSASAGSRQLRQRRYGGAQRLRQVAPSSEQPLPADAGGRKRLSQRVSVQPHQAPHRFEQRLPVLHAEQLDPRARRGLTPERPLYTCRGQHPAQSLRRAADGLPDQAAEEVGDREPLRGVDVLVEAPSLACLYYAVAGLLELERVGVTGACGGVPQIGAAGRARRDVPRVGSQVVKLLRAVAAGVPVDKRTTVPRATGVRSQPPADPVVRGGVFTETRRAVLPSRGPSPPSAQRDDPRPRPWSFGRRPATRDPIGSSAAAVIASAVTPALRQSSYRRSTGMPRSASTLQTRHAGHNAPVSVGGAHPCASAQRASHEVMVSSGSSATGTGQAALPGRAPGCHAPRSVGTMPCS